MKEIAHINGSNSTGRRNRKPRYRYFNFLFLYYSFRSYTLQKQLRYVLAVISILLFICIPIRIAIWFVYETGVKGVYQPIPFNELMKSAIDIRLDESKNLFQTGLVLLGGIWGLLIAKKDEAVLVFEDYPEIIMCVSSSLLFLTSFVCHILYLGMIMDIYKDSGTIEGNDKIAGMGESAITYIPDVFATNIEYLFIAQTSFLSAGTVIALLTFVSAHKLK